MSEVDVMKDILVVAPDTMTGGRPSEWRSITDRLGPLERQYYRARDHPGSATRDAA